MSFLSDNCTIVAISSGLKNAAIGVIRVSGPEALNFLSKIFVPYRKQVDILNSKGYRAYYGTLQKDGEFIDEVIVTIYRKPHSYTGEDMVEISCHGNVILMQKIIDVFLDMGCRLAKPGEFTLRAILNQKIDISKAIAIRDIIESTTEQMLRLSLNNLRGSFSSKINWIRERLLYWIPWLEALIDFPEEDIPDINLEDLKLEIIGIIEQIEKIISNYHISKMYREGIDTVIIGKPNVGKSTLFNYLYGQERVIISDIPGTTRDIITEYINFNGVILKLYDTAGFRKTSDIIERIGIQKAKEIIDRAQLIFWVIEYDNLDENDMEIVSNLSKDKRIIIIINKIDKEKDKEKIKKFEEKVKNLMSNILVNFAIVSCSIKENINMDILRELVPKIIGLDGQDEIILVDNFQYEILKKIVFFLKRAIEDFNLSVEIIAINLREALNCITELTGENLSDTVIENLLSRFCVGK
ncbi:MAG: tRNA uridine-5-carboxymethylaminomethyl(34) synthesis GTPase MnmE [Candidatus Calescibacterium sp.]|nr:tRNA uridine-5-carboxymethylaminomethyl(34) synthesis GTPase MnmE [Candidatus Calescibacterium sp.]MCX7972504.1 tRNA uridine-5-carboxymethylaminomethyl(34) synthesis GTPase MnmE [bacterium]MDW8195604.1 tRNA uridine-5-carboxymethylaminomethyl(34) synthesis GTPase MnmE [Candidatus Calescibacterium sp.]